MSLENYDEIVTNNPEYDDRVKEIMYTLAQEVDSMSEDELKKSLMAMLLIENIEALINVEKVKPILIHRVPRWMTALNYILSFPGVVLFNGLKSKLTVILIVSMTSAMAYLGMFGDGGLRVALWTMAVSFSGILCSGLELMKSNWRVK